MRKTFKYRIYPTRTQEQTLDRWLWLCRRLYNAYLEQRKIAWQQRRRIGKYDQMAELPDLKAELAEYREVDAQALQDVAERLDKAFQRFFKIKGTGYPKFQNRDRYNSITFKQTSWKLKGERLRLRGCGPLKVRWSRPVEGDIKTVTVKRSRSGKWFVCFSCDNVPAPCYPATDKAIGIDLGIECLVTTSNGERLGETKFLKAKLKQLRRIQRHLARQKNKRSNRRKKTVRQLARLHEHIANQRQDLHHKISTKLVRENAEIHHEDISPKFMLANHHLAQAASDMAWGMQLNFLQSKSATAGRKLVAKNPYRTSMECDVCGGIQKMPLHTRWYDCPACGNHEHRDVNAARVILKRPA